MNPGCTYLIRTQQPDAPGHPICTAVNPPTFCNPSGKKCEASHDEKILAVKEIEKAIEADKIRKGV